MNMLKLVLPPIVLLLAAFVAALPWGMPADLRLLLLPLLPLVIMHVFIARDSSGIEDWVVFLAGLTTDALGQGPLGYWSLVYLVGYATLRSNAFQGLGTLAAIAAFAVVTIQLAMLQWALASLYYLRLMEVWPLVSAALAAVAIDAVLMLLTVGTPSRRPAASNLRLERGR